MSRLLRSAAIAALTMAACAVAGAAGAQTYNRLVVFGDSLSDNGNLFAATAGTQPPAAVYWQGRSRTGRCSPNCWASMPVGSPPGRR